MSKQLGMLGLVVMFGLTGCVGTIIGATTDAAIEVVKIPFKIGGAAVDMMKGKDPDEVGHRARDRDDDEDDQQEDERDDPSVKQQT
jgi:hypothetical protein